MECKHKTIVISNMTGKKIKTGCYEVNLVVRCNECDETFLNISERGREIVNISKH